MTIDPEQLARIVTEEVLRYLNASGQGPSAPLASSSCGCPLPAVSGPTTADAFPAPAPQPTSPALSAIPPPPPATPRKRVLCLFSGANEGFDVFLSGIEAWIGQGVGVDGLYSESARAILPVQRLEAVGVRTVTDPSQFGKLFEELKNYDLILLPTLSRTYVAKMALGITDTLQLNLTYTALSYGLKVMGSTDGLLPSACPVCANNLPGIPEMLDEYQARVRRLGVQLFPMARLIPMGANHILGVGPASAVPDSEVIDYLITQHEAVQLPGPVVRVTRGGLVTPLARDVLAQRGIEVEVCAKT